MSRCSTCNRDTDEIRATAREELAAEILGVLDAGGGPRAHQLASKLCIAILGPQRALDIRRSAQSGLARARQAQRQPKTTDRGRRP